MTSRNTLTPPPPVRGGKFLKAAALAVAVAILIAGIAVSFFSIHIDSESNAAELAEDQVDVYINGSDVLNSWQYLSSPTQPHVWNYNASLGSVVCETNGYTSGFINPTEDLEKIEFWASVGSNGYDDDGLGILFHSSGSYANFSSYLFFIEGGGWVKDEINNVTGPYVSPGIRQAMLTKGSATALYQIDNAEMACPNFQLRTMPNSSKLFWDTTVGRYTNIHAIVEGNNIKIYVNNVLQIDYTDTSASALTHGSFGFFCSSQPARFKDVRYVATLATYNLSFDANLEGAQIQGDTDISGISTKTWKKNLPTAYHRSYKFLGWNTKPDGTGIDMTSSIAAGNPVNVTSDTTLYAQWEKIPFIIEAQANNDGFGSATVSWADYEYVNKNFKVYQSADGGTTWNSVGIDYHDVKEVRCLQIYPIIEAKDSYKAWLEQGHFGQGIIKCDSVYIDDYNNNPSKYLLDSDGSYKYDVIFFSGWNYYNHKDLCQASLDATQAYINSGRGAIFGGDTILNWYNAGYREEHPFFNRLASYLQLETPIIGWEQSKNGNKWVSDTVEIIKPGILWNYPNTLNKGIHDTFKVYRNGSITKANGTIWAKFDTAVENIMPNTINNFFLTTTNNCAYIMTGYVNSISDPIPDEEKSITANLIFYMNQLLFEKTRLRDASAQDTAAPEITGHVFAPDTETISLNGKDNGNTYSYYAESYDKDDTTATGLIHTSNIDDITVETGLKKYQYVFSTDTTMDTNTLKSTGELLAPGDSISYAGHYGQYLYVLAIDGAGNISDVKRLKIPAKNATSISGMKKMSNDTKIFNQEFSFSLMNNDMKVISSTTNNESGTFEFSNVELTDYLSAIDTADGLRSYQSVFYIKEDMGNDKNVIYDDSLYRVTLNTHDEYNDGNLVVDSIVYEKIAPDTLEVSSIEPALLFTNTRLIVMPDTGSHVMLLLILLGTALTLSNIVLTWRKQGT